MQKKNLYNYKWSITDWTELNYINGGLADNLTDIINIKVNDSCYNYLANSVNIHSGASSYDGIMNNNINRTVDLGNLPLGTYTISFDIIANDNNRTFVLFYYNNGVRDSGHDIITYIDGTGTNKTFTFTLNGSVPYDDIRLGLNSGTNNYRVTLEHIMLVKGSTAPTAYEPYGALIIHQNAGRILGSDYANNIITDTTRGGLRCAVIQTDKSFVNSNTEVVVAKNNLGLTTMSAGSQWTTTAINVIACNDQKRILINFDQSLTDEQMIERAKTLILDYQLLNPTIIVLKSVDLGTLTWGYNYNRFRANIADIKLLTSTTEVPNISISNGFAILSNSEYITRDKCASVATAAPGAILIRDSDYTDAVEFKAAMNGVILLYETTE